MEVFDNVNKRVYEDFKKEIKEKTMISMASAYFSIYAYKELKKELEEVKEFRFIFTEPTFTEEMAEKKSREFYIPRLSREKGIYGTDFFYVPKNCRKTGIHTGVTMLIISYQKIGLDMMYFFIRIYQGKEDNQTA